MWDISVNKIFPLRVQFGSEIPTHATSQFGIPSLYSQKMPAPLHAWIQDAAIAQAIDESNTIQREHLREQLIPFIEKIHRRNVTYSDEIIPLSDFIGNHMGNQLDYKIEKYKRDIVHPEAKFSAPKLAQRPDYMQHVDPEFVKKLTAPPRADAE